MVAILLLSYDETQISHKQLQLKDMYHKHGKVKYIIKYLNWKTNYLSNFV